MDTAGLILRVHVHPADEQDRDSRLDLLVGAEREFPRVRQLWADAGYQGPFAKTGWVTIVRPAADQVGFAVQPRRWIVERTFAHLGRYRRLAKDFEHLAESPWPTASPPPFTSCSSALLPLKLDSQTAS